MSVHTEAHKEFVKFFVSQYTKLLAQAQLQYLFRRLREEYVFSSKIDAADGSWWMLERGSGSGGSSVLDTTIRHTNMYGFDIVFAISQTSINMQLRTGLTGKSMIFPRWDRGGFVIEVKSVNVRLLNGGKAIVVVNILEGSLKELLNTDLKLVHE